MRLSPSIFFLMLLATAAGQTLDDGNMNDFILNRMNAPSEGKAHLDSKRIINRSSSFLKEREPEMNAEEYALYQRVVEMFAERILS